MTELLITIEYNNASQGQYYDTSKLPIIKKRGVHVSKDCGLSHTTIKGVISRLFGCVSRLPRNHCTPQNVNLGIMGVRQFTFSDTNESHATNATYRKQGAKAGMGCRVMPVKLPMDDDFIKACGGVSNIEQLLFSKSDEYLTLDDYNLFQKDYERIEQARIGNEKKEKNRISNLKKLDDYLKDNKHVPSSDEQQKVRDKIAANKKLNGTDMRIQHYLMYGNCITYAEFARVKLYAIYYNLEFSYINGIPGVAIASTTPRDFYDFYAKCTSYTQRGTANVTRSNGELIISNKCKNTDDAKQLKLHIMSAGVAVLRIGKKGMASVTNIRINK